MAKRFKLNVGDVFTIPLNETEVGFGQVISEYNKVSGGFLTAIFSNKKQKDQPIIVEEIVNTPPIFVGFTFDAKLYYKDWSVIGNYTENITAIKKPYSKLGLPPDEIYLIDPNNNKVAKISEDVFNELEYRTEIAPIIYENALKAHFGIEEWKHDDYDEILYINTLKSNEIANRVLAIS